MSDRAVSVTVNYALNLAVAAVVLAGVLTATAGVVVDHREGAGRSELRVVGQRLAADIETADRLANAGGETVVVTSPLPDRVAGVSYTVEVEGSTLVLDANFRDVSVEVPYRTNHTVAATTVSGGELRVVLAPDADGDGQRNLEVRR